MVFEAMTDDTRVVDIYEKKGRYKIDGDIAYQITEDGQQIPVSIPYVLSLIARHRRHYKHKGEPVTFKSYWMLAGISFGFTILVGGLLWMWLF